MKFNYLEEEKDLEDCKLVHLLERVATSQSVAFYLGFKHQNNLITSTNDQREFCILNAKTYLLHYHGGCTVGLVVDNSFKVMKLRD